MTREDGSTGRRRRAARPPRRPRRARRADAHAQRQPRDGDEYWLLTKATVVHDEAGRPLAVNIIQDVTVAKETERRQRFLAEAGRLLASSLHCERTLAAASRGSRSRRSATGARSTSSATTASFDRVAVSHADPAKLALVERLRAELAAAAAARPADAVAARGAQRARRSCSARIAGEPGHALGDRRADALGRARPRGHLARRRPTAAASCTAADLAFVEDLALRAGAAVENARLFGEQARTAQTLQDSLLPSPPARARPLPRGVLVPRRRRRQHGRRRLLRPLRRSAAASMVLLGDVTGKGVDAAALTALVRHTAKTAARFDSRPSAVLRVVDEILREQARRRS